VIDSWGRCVRAGSVIEIACASTPATRRPREEAEREIEKRFMKKAHLAEVGFVVFGLRSI